MAEDSSRPNSRRPRKPGQGGPRKGAPKREGYQKRDGDRPRRDGDKPRGTWSKDGDRPRRDGDKPRGNWSKDGDRPRRDDRARGEGRPARDSRPPRGDRPQRSSRPPQEVREDRVPEPQLPDDVTAKDLHPAARNQLKTLSPENADRVARHLAMAAILIDDDPELANEHAVAATHRAGRIAVVRETAGITAYALGDFATALRELRTYRRISGNDDQIALIVDSERGMGRPDRALEEARSVKPSELEPAVRVALAIAKSGARLDQGDLDLALGELEIPEADPNTAFEWSPDLFTARAVVLEELGRDDEAAFWYERAEAASEALIEAAGGDELIISDLLPEEASAPRKHAAPSDEPREQVQEP